jgi:hypothetical protein
MQRQLLGELNSFAGSIHVDVREWPDLSEIFQMPTSFSADSYHSKVSLSRMILSSTFLRLAMN